MKKSAAQVKKMVKNLKKLRPSVVPRSMFGDDNLAALDAAVWALEESASEEDVYSRYSNDGCEIADSAIGAINWRDGDDEEPPDQGWPTR